MILLNKFFLILCLKVKNDLYLEFLNSMSLKTKSRKCLEVYFSQFELKKEWWDSALTKEEFREFL